MIDKLTNWRQGSASWMLELGRALEVYGKNDVVVPYIQVALAFPSSDPNSLTFNSPKIDLDQLEHWASARDWQVRSATEMASIEETDYPPVRFTRRPKTHHS